MHYSNTVLIWYRCINVLWHHRYWSIMAQRLMWEGLSRSAETPSMVQEKGIPRREPTHHRATALSRRTKLVVWEKCCKQIIQSKSPLPATRITSKNKSHINCECQQSKMWLIFLNAIPLPLLPPREDFPHFTSLVEKYVHKGSSSYKEFFVHTGYWHSKHTYRSR